MNTRVIAIPTEPTGTRQIVQTLLFTAAGVGTLFILGKGIHAIGQASGLPTTCWQLTGTRAAAAALVVGSMARFRVGHLALFGIGYGATMLSSHTNWTLLGSAALAGVAAWLVYTLFTLRRPASIAGVLLPALAYTLTITLSGLINAMTSATPWTKLGSWSSGIGIRAATTVIAVLALWFITRPHNRACVNDND